MYRWQTGGKLVKRPTRWRGRSRSKFAVRGKSVAVTMRTPGHDRELAAGFLLTEGIVRESQGTRRDCHLPREPEPRNTLDVFLAAGVEVDFARLTRHVFATSSCGFAAKRPLKR